MTSDPKTLFEKVWEQHVVVEPKGEPTLLYIDLQLVHEVTSPQAFEGLRLAGRKVRRPDRTVATVDHNVPTTKEGRLNIVDPISATQIKTLRQNCADFGVELYRRELARAGHCARDRARTRPHQAGHDNCLRRFAHRDARRIRSACVSALAPARWSMCWPRRRCRSRSPKLSASRLRASCRSALRRRTSFSPSSARSAPTARRVA